VHHNTVRFVESRSVGIRGVPVFAAEVYRNWFYHTGRDDAVWFFEEESHADVYSEYENFFGPLPPPGTYLPVASASASPPAGRAPLTVGFDGSASCDPDGAIVSHHWDFGDGAVAEGDRATYTYNAVGRYNVTLTVTDDSGIPVRDMIPVTVYPSDSTYVLDFWVKDGYRGTRQDFYTKQALLDGVVVWEDDVAQNEGWDHVSLDVAAQVEGKESVELGFRVVSETAVTDPETQLIELDVYWDDVILFGGNVPNGDFEQSGGWTFTESGDDTPWGGRSRSGEVRSGNGAFWITHPYNTASTAGTWGEAGQVVTLGDPDIRGLWLMDEAGGSMAEDSSLYGNHAALVNMDESGARVEGAMGRALRFDGTDDYLDCRGHASLASPAGSLELWISSGADAGPMDFLFIHEDETENYLLVSRDESGSIRVVIEDGGAALVDLASSAAVPGDGEFHHLVVTQDGGGVKIFIDGEESAAAGTNAGAWTDHLVLPGAWIGRGGESYFTGTLDNVVFYARALSADDIRGRHESVRARGLWHFDEGGGAEALDDSGFGNNAALVNMDPASCWIEGVEGTALLFDGIDDLVDCGADASLLPAGDMTIELWVRFDSFTENEQVLGNNLYRIFHRGDWAGDRLYFLQHTVEQEAAGDSAWDYWSGVVTSTNLAAGWWYHIAAVRKGETMSLYVNGEKESEMSCLSGRTVDDSGARELVFGGEPFSGALDEVALYPRALSAGEIMQHFDAG
jgi:PKD repeat protein